MKFKALLKYVWSVIVNHFKKNGTPNPMKGFKVSIERSKQPNGSVLLTPSLRNPDLFTVVGNGMKVEGSYLDEAAKATLSTVSKFVLDAFAGIEHAGYRFNVLDNKWEKI